MLTKNNSRTSLPELVRGISCLKFRTSARLKPVNAVFSLNVCGLKFMAPNSGRIHCKWACYMLHVRNMLLKTSRSRKLHFLWIPWWSFNYCLRCNLLFNSCSQSQVKGDAAICSFVSLLAWLKPLLTRTHSIAHFHQLYLITLLPIRQCYATHVSVSCRIQRCSLTGPSGLTSRANREVHADVFTSEYNMSYVKLPNLALSRFTSRGLSTVLCNCNPGPARDKNVNELAIH